MLNAVIETGGVSTAARRLALSQPAVTEAVRDIQRESGAALLERRGCEMCPTQLCADLYRMTAESERWQREASRLPQRHGDLGQDEFHLGFDNAMPGISLIGSFRARFPGVRVGVELGSSSQIIEAVVEGRVAVRILPNVPNDGRCLRTICLVQDVVAIVGQDQPLSDRV